MTFRPYPLIFFTLMLILASASAAGWTAEYVGSVLGIPLFLLLCFLWPGKWSPRNVQVRDLCAVVLCLFVIFSVCATHWPLKMQYKMIKSNLNRIAALVEAKKSVAMPQRIGLIQIVKVQVWDNGVICLWTDDDPNGPSGFVRTSPEKVDSQFNLWAHIDIDDQWQFIEID